MSFATVAAVVTTAATGYSAYSKKRSQDKANDAARDASSPEAQLEALRRSADFHIETAPRLAELDRQMMPGLVDNNLASQERLQFGSEDQRGLFDMLRESTPILDQIAQDSNRSAREADLADVEANALDRALQRCNRVVKAHPQDPRPRNDRFLLHTLLQNKEAACQDIAQAAALLQTSGAKSHNDLRTEILVRADSCR